jgi:hypothetical protein
MLSDAILDGVESIDHYIEDEIFKDAYSEETRNQVIALRNKMMALALWIARSPVGSPEGKAMLENSLNNTLLGKNPNNSIPCPIFLLEAEVAEFEDQFNLTPVEIINLDGEE